MWLDLTRSIPSVYSSWRKQVSGHDAHWKCVFHIKLSGSLYPYWHVTFIRYGIWLRTFFVVFSSNIDGLFEYIILFKFGFKWVGNSYINQVYTYAQMCLNSEYEGRTILPCRFIWKALPWLFYFSFFLFDRKRKKITMQTIKWATVT